MSELINDEQALHDAWFDSGTKIPVYDDGFGPLWIFRDSMGIQGIARAQTWHEAWGICEDEFLPSADDDAFSPPYDERTEHERNCWDEAYGYRPNGQGGPTPETDRGIYAKDLNGEWLDRLTTALMYELGINLDIRNHEE